MSSLKSNLPIRYVIVEGPDLAGKTTFISNLHKSTRFSYNIQDRSCLSMLCYARQYGRDVEKQRQFLKEELSDLNNFFVILLPDEEVLLERLAYRGDEFQDSTSVLKLRQIFLEESLKIQHLPNVLLIRSINSAAQIAESVSRRIKSHEDSLPLEVGDMVSLWVNGSQFVEEQLRFKIDLSPDYDDPSILENQHEKEYYSSILNDCCRIIQDEIDGKNCYNLPQDLTSRRFYFSSNSCISSIHFLPRDGDVKVICTLRSTDVRKNGSIDTRFLAHLATFITRKFLWPAKSISLVVNLNSAHVRQDVI